MADVDLDVLLDEFEKDAGGDTALAASLVSADSKAPRASQKVSSEKGSNESITSTSAKLGRGALSSGNKRWDELNELLQEIGVVEDLQNTAQTQSYKPINATTVGSKASSSSVKLLSNRGNRKCMPTYIGPPSIGFGLCSGSSQAKLCDNLRCLGCDFRCVLLHDREWTSECEYLFFRNNMPDMEKLAVQTTRKRGWMAVCCQCSWTNTDSLVDLASKPNLRWVCGGHADAAS